MPYEHQNSTPLKITALLIPTFGYTKQNMATLQYLADFSNPELHVIISDCSTNPEKHLNLLEIEKKHSWVTIIYQKEKIGLYKDIANMLEIAKDYRYIAIVPDDGYVSLSYIENSVKLLEIIPNCVCSYGNYIIYQTNGAAFRDSRQSNEKTAIERLNNGFDPNYFNTMIFAVYRRPALQAWADFCKDHCMISAFFDFIHCASLMAQGVILCHLEGHFLWTGENWDTSEKNANTRARYYQQIGLTADFAIFHDLHFGIEGINFFTGKNSPLLNLEERENCARIFWNKCFDRFKTFVYLEPQLFHDALKNSDEAIEAFHTMLNDKDISINLLPYLFTLIIEIYSPTLALKYRQQFCIGNQL